MFNDNDEYFNLFNKNDNILNKWLSIVKTTDTIKLKGLKKAIKQYLGIDENEFEYLISNDKLEEKINQYKILNNSI